MKTSCLTRRRFVGQLLLSSGVCATFPEIISSSVLGAAKPSNKITIGFVGTGRQCIYANIPGFLREKDAQCVAVCDVDLWRMEFAKKSIEDYYAKNTQSAEFKGCATFRDWRELINRRDIDVVMISTPDHWHVPMAISAINAGKDVACEKPLTRNIAEGRKLSNLVKEKNRMFRTDSEFRSSKSFHKAAQIARNGKIGKLQKITVGLPKDDTLPPQLAMSVPSELDYDMWLGPAPEVPYTEKRVHPRNDARGRPGWICIRDYADGMLANWGAHLNDIALWGTDLEHTGPIEIDAKAKYPPKENLWNVFLEITANFLFANGLQLICKTEKPYIKFEGTEGWIQVTYPNQIDVSNDDLLSWQPSNSDVSLPFKYSEKRDFLDAVKSRKQPLYDCETGHRVNSLSHLALASAEVGRKIKWDPVREVVIGDDEANAILKPKPMRPPWSI